MLTALEFTQVPEQERAFRAEVRAFLKNEMQDVPAHIKSRSWMGTDDNFSRRLAAKGWLGLTIPAEYGGSGKGFSQDLYCLKSCWRLARLSLRIGSLTGKADL